MVAENFKNTESIASAEKKIKKKKKETKGTVLDTDREEKTSQK